MAAAGPAGQTRHMSRMLRSLLILVAVGLLLAACAGPARQAGAPSPPSLEPLGPLPAASAAPVEPEAVTVTLIRSPTCGCCSGHAEHLAAAGYDVESVLTEAFTTVKDAHSVPDRMRSCHTTLVNEYFIEGHVPAEAIAQLLAERPDIDGIALPGMPAGSPGMGGIADGPLTIWAIAGGEVVGEFGRFEAPTE